MAILLVPESLSRFTNGRSLEVFVQTLNEFPEWLKKEYNALYEVIFFGERLKGFVNLYLDDCAVTHRVREPLPISGSSSLRLVTSVSGG